MLNWPCSPELLSGSIYYSLEQPPVHLLHSKFGSQSALDRNEWICQILYISSLAQSASWQGVCQESQGCIRCAHFLRRQPEGKPPQTVVDCDAWVGVDIGMMSFLWCCIFTKVIYRNEMCGVETTGTSYPCMFLYRCCSRHTTRGSAIHASSPPQHT